ncbi:MAG: glycerol-3-phosphate dehydrogenase/oxidase [Nitrospirales bacterium]|nr:glycerol-3-phosphate dehydrogenase/oxidase [Nitrospira sp.]MDR4503042.1 glycerol-3-phosphate dehydrogenase/oxidase [Nitrospirales bacterium]
MNRSLEGISEIEYDVIIIGGGIYGVSAARDAAFRGLKVLLLEQGDFGHATSSNSHKIIHGGLRYLQHGDLPRMRESIAERSTLVRIAPHLVKPMPFLIPTYSHIGAKKLLLRVALAMNDCIAFDRNRHLPEPSQFPPSRIMSSRETLERGKIISSSQLTGGAYYFDAQVRNSERLILSLLQSAHEKGAVCLNYVRVSKLLTNHGSVWGVQAEDIPGKTTLEIRAKCVVDCSGPWVNRLVPSETRSTTPGPLPLLKAVVLVTDLILEDVALGVPGHSTYNDTDAVINKGRRYFFIVPWRNRSLVGTFQTPYDGHPDEASVSEQEIDMQLEEVNASLQQTKITRKHVQFVYWGLLPRNDGQGSTHGDVQLSKHAVIYDHETQSGIKGLISVSGVKFTTARAVSEKAINLVMTKLRRPSTRCTTATTPVYGGDFSSYEQVLQGALARKPPSLSSDIVTHLVETYGSRFIEIFQYIEENPELGTRLVADIPVSKAEVIHGIREEMAQTLSDIVFRRTELGTAGYLSDDGLLTCANTMARELGWDEHQLRDEVSKTNADYRRRGVI